MIRFGDIISRTRREHGNDFKMHPVVAPLSKVTTWLLVNLGISANQTTVVFFFAAIASAGVFAIGTTTSALVGATLYWLHVILDFSDGDIARYHQSFARNGEYWDHTIHLLTIPLILAGVVFGEVRHGAPEGVIAGGLLLVVAGAFNYGLNDVSRLATASPQSEATGAAKSWLPVQVRWVMRVATRAVGIAQFVFWYTLTTVLFDDPRWHELVIIGSAIALLLAGVLKSVVAHRAGSLPRRADLLN